MKTARSILVLAGGALVALDGLATATVKVEDWVFPTYAFSDPDPVPHPVHRAYPYYCFDGQETVPANKTWKVVVLENDKIRVTMLPEIGGKVWGAEDKKTGKPFIYYNHVVKFRNLALRGPWTSGGIEFNFGEMCHAAWASTPVDWSVRRNDDGSVSYFCGDSEYIAKTHWQVEVRLGPDDEFFSTTSTFYNPSTDGCRKYNWMNGAFALTDKCSFYFDGMDYIGHKGDPHAWPRDSEGHELSKWRGNAFGASKSYHVLNGNPSFYGIWWPEWSLGGYHDCDDGDKYGRKIWLWAQSREGAIWDDFLTDSDGSYTELQSGLAFVQPRVEAILDTPFGPPEFAPGATERFTERWGLVRNEAEFDRISGTERATPRPMARPADFSTNTIYGLVHVADVLFRGGDYDSGATAAEVRARIVGMYEKALSQDPNYVPALLGLGRFFLRYGDYAKAIEAAHRAIAVYSFDPEANWIEGFAAFATGDNATALERLGAAAYSPAFRAGALSTMARIHLRRGAFDKAERAAEKTLDSNRYSEDACKVLAVIKARSACQGGDAEKSRAFFAAALHDLPLCRILRREAERAGFLPEGWKATFKTELHREAIVEDGEWYETSGLFEEALNAYAEAGGILAGVRRAYLLHRLGREDEALNVLHSAEGLSSAFANPLGLAYLPALAWAAGQGGWKAKYLFAVYELACSRDRHCDGLLAGIDAADEYWALLFRASRRNGTARLADLEKALKLDRNWRTLHALARYYDDVGDYEKMREIARAAEKDYPQVNKIQILMADALAKSGQKEACVAYLEKTTIVPSEHRDNGSAIWQGALLDLARQALDAGDRERAKGCLEKALSYPENLGAGKPYDLLPVIETWPKELQEIGRGLVK